MESSRRDLGSGVKEDLEAKSGSERVGERVGEGSQ